MVIQAIGTFFWLYGWMLFVRILLSWIPEAFQYRWAQFLAYCTDPYLDLFRRFIPPIGPLDISPIFAFLALIPIQWLVTLVVLWLRFP